MHDEYMLQIQTPKIQCEQNDVASLPIGGVSSYLMCLTYTIPHVVRQCPAIAFVSVHPFSFSFLAKRLERFYIACPRYYKMYEEHISFFEQETDEARDRFFLAYRLYRLLARA